MIIWSLVFTICVFIFLIRQKNLKVAFVASMICLFSFYLIGYKLKLDLLFSLITIDQLISYLIIVLLTILVYVLYILLDKTKIFNDWHEVWLSIFPYTIHKSFFLFFAVQLLFINYNYLLICIGIVAILARSLRIKRLHAFLVIILSLVTKIIISNMDKLIGVSSEIFDFYNSYSIWIILFIIIMNAVLFSIIAVLDKASYSVVTNKADNLNISKFLYATTTIITSISFGISFIITSFYFSPLVSNSISSIICIIIIGVIAKYIYPKREYIDHDDFYQTKGVQRPIILSFIILVIILAINYLLLSQIPVASLVLMTLLVIFVKYVYKIEFKETEFNITTFAFMFIIGSLFWFNSFVVESSMYNNFVFETTLPSYLYDSVNSSNMLLTIAQYLLYYPFISVEYISYTISESSSDIFDLLLVIVCSITTVISMFTIPFLLLFMKIKNSDYRDMFSVLLLYITIFIGLLMLCTLLFT